MDYQILFEGMREPKSFKGLFEALEYVVAHGKQSAFMLKTAGAQTWQDGAKFFRSAQRMFAPVGSEFDDED